MRNTRGILIRLRPQLDGLGPLKALLGPAELGLDQAIVTAARRGQELELDRGLSDLDRVVADEDPAPLAVQGEVDFFAAGQETHRDRRGRRHGHGPEGQRMGADRRDDDGRDLGMEDGPAGQDIA
jgi:hypothetical protein